jgi:two-component system nitrogen regulation sensor histidine kinase NtrY
MVSETTFPERRAGLRAVSRPSQLAFAVALLAVVSVCVTYVLLIRVAPNKLSDASLIALGAVNITLALVLAGLIGWRVARLMATRRTGRAGAKLHVRLVTWFAAIAVVPAIIVAMFASVTLNMGMEAWFSTRVKDALGSAENVAHQFIMSEARGITLDAGQIAESLAHDPSLIDRQNQLNTVLMMDKIRTMTQDRGLVGSFLLDGRGNEVAKSAAVAFSAVIKPSAADISDAQHGKIVVDGDPGTGIAQALIVLPFLKDVYLLVVQRVDPQVFAYYQRTKAAVSEYVRLDQSSTEIELVFAGLYALVSLIVLLAAVWAGLWAANRLVRPISDLVEASEKVSGGDLSAQVRVTHDDDELGTLGLAFNRMTGQLSAQRDDLVEANRLNEARRRFTETVLLGVSAGVVGVDHDGLLTIVNRAGARLLDAAPEEMEGTHYAESMPELAALIRRAMDEPVGRASGEVQVRRGGKTRTLSVQVASETDARGFVVTFDDITDLVSAQRTAAWADVARRIAHEIKNPLTPIQLSAERLKRKYAGEITSDPEIFQQCTDTIVRQVGDIGRMVDEFSSFARMPAPVMKRENALELLSQAVFLQRVAHPDIAFSTEAPKEPVWFEGDGRLIAQALTNVLKNAGEGIAARLAKGDDAPGRIVAALERATNGKDGGASLVYRIADNGVGLPPEHRHRLTEPYVTTRAKGTGLGLAIVRKIMEDHGGEISLNDSESGEGAIVVLSLPLVQKSVKGREEDDQKRIVDRV